MIIAGFFSARPERCGAAAGWGKGAHGGRRKAFQPRLTGIRGFSSGGHPHRPFWMIAGIYCSFGFCRATFLAPYSCACPGFGFFAGDGANILRSSPDRVCSAGSHGACGGQDRQSKRLHDQLCSDNDQPPLGLAAHDLWKLYLFAFLFGVGWGNQAVLRFS